MSGEPTPGPRPIAETLRLLTLARACPHRTPGRTGCEWGTCGLAGGARVAPADCFACAGRVREVDAEAEAEAASRPREPSP